VSSLLGRTVVSAIITKKQVAKTPQYFSKIVVNYLRGVCDYSSTSIITYSACNTLFREGEFAYQFSNRIFKVSTTTCASSMFFQNLSCNIFFK
jgi:hypothetical protein